MSSFYSYQFKKKKIFIKFFNVERLPNAFVPLTFRNNLLCMFL